MRRYRAPTHLSRAIFVPVPGVSLRSLTTSVASVLVALGIVRSPNRVAIALNPNPRHVQM
jgi:hypothetical protein